MSEKEQKMFGCAAKDVLAAVEKHIATDGLPMVLLSLLSDVQEMVNRGQVEQARQAINRVKYLIDKKVPGTIVFVPSTEGNEGALVFDAPPRYRKEEIDAMVARASKEANDDHGDRSGEVVRKLEAVGLVFLGNPGTSTVFVTEPWI